MTQIHRPNPTWGQFTTASDWSGGVVPGPSDDAILDAAGTFTVTARAAEVVNGFQQAKGTQIHWLNPVSGQFTTASDWSGGVVPGPSDDAILDAAGTFTVTASVAEVVNSIQLGKGAQLAIDASFTASAGTGAGANAGTISIDDGGTLTLAGAVDNTGAIDLNAFNNVALLNVGSGGVTLSGGGTVTLSDIAGNRNQFGAAGLINVDNTISGAGLVTVGVNGSQGVIDATGRNALYVNVGLNDGLIEATGGATLLLSGTINNAGGIILVGAGSTAVFDGAVIEGGTLTGAGSFPGSPGRGLDGTLDGRNSPVTLATRISLYSDNDLELLGTIVNTSTIEVSEGGTVVVDGPQTSLTGGGTIAMGFEGRLLGFKGDSLVNVNDTIVGSGTVGNYATVLINDATGVIDGSGMTLQAGGAVMTNAGLIEGTSRGLIIASTTIDNGTTGIILAGAKSKVKFLQADIRGGVLEAGVKGQFLVAGAGNVFDGTTNAVSIEASISFGGRSSLTIEGALINSGTIDLKSAGEPPTLIVGAPGVTLNGGGAITLAVAGSIVEGASGAATLTNVDNTLSGSGSLGNGRMGLVNEAAGVIEATGATALVINLGANTIVNAGLIESLGATSVGLVHSAVDNTGTLEAAGGTLTFAGAVTGAGQAVISSGTLAFKSSFDEAVIFAGNSGVLRLAQSQAFTATISGFSDSGVTSLDLHDIGFVSANEAIFSGTASGGTLTVTDGTHTAHIALNGDYVGDTFTASSDGGGGTSIVATGGNGGSHEIHWLNPMSGQFTTASDWSGGVVPGPSDDAILDAAGTFTVTASVAEVVNSIQLGKGAQLAIGASFTASTGTGGGANAGTISVDDAGTLTLAGVVENTGAIDLNAVKNFALFEVGSGGVTLTGGGTVTLSDIAGNRNQFGGGGLVNVDNTISGAGLVRVGVNGSQGVIDATGRNALYVNVGVNDGLIEATGGAQLNLAGTINNAGGIILVGAGSTAVFESAVIEGGTLTGAGSFPGYSGLFFEGTLDGRNSPVTLAVRISLYSDNSLELLGTIVNTSTIEVSEGGTVVVDGPQTSLTGGGTIAMQEGRLLGFSGDSLVNVNDTIIGSGAVGGYGMMLTNKAAGVIDGSGMTFQAGGAVTTNAGLIEGTSNGLIIASTTIDNGTAGVILAGAGSKVTLSGADIQGGVLESGAGGSIVASGSTDTLDGTKNAVADQATLYVTTTLAIEGSVANSGSIVLLYGSLVVDAPGVTLSGGGTLVMNYASDVIEGASGAATLTNVNNTLSGSGSLGNGRMGLVNEAAGVIEATGATALVINLGANTIVNAGMIETLGGTSMGLVHSAVENTGTLEAAGGTLIFAGAVTGAGQAVISSGTLAFKSSFDEAVIFAGNSGVLRLAQSQAFTATISGFSDSGVTSLDLHDIGFVSANEAIFSGTASGGTLTVTDGTHTAHISLTGDYLGDTFTAAGDGSGGTSVVATGGNDEIASLVRQFISVAASLGGSEWAPLSQTADFAYVHGQYLTRPLVQQR